mmetsp:Transcript_62808/g.104484  ORF Transcript_62808/g.104484 Transcript_62808/m.104484 type:complete len:214 (-) Transcript_62808:3965-4606(-)
MGHNLEKRCGGKKSDSPVPVSGTCAPQMCELSKTEPHTTFACQNEKSSVPPDREIGRAKQGCVLHCVFCKMPHETFALYVGPCGAFQIGTLNLHHDASEHPLRILVLRLGMETPPRERRGKMKRPGAVPLLGPWATTLKSVAAGKSDSTNPHFRCVNSARLSHAPRLRVGVAGALYCQTGTGHATQDRALHLVFCKMPHVTSALYKAPAVRFK